MFYDCTKFLSFELMICFWGFGLRGSFGLNDRWGFGPFAPAGGVVKEIHVEKHY